mgnify:CR=1 FL=1
MELSRLFAARDLGSRDNSLNLIRLLLAFMVLYSHAEILTGVGDGIKWQGQHIGSWAVVGFFAISGFLITGSRERSDAGRYLLNRVTRIFPGFLLALVFVAFFLAPIAQVIETGSLRGYFSTPVTPGYYVYGNILLRIMTYEIGTTLADIPYPKAWNGSLWSLYIEFWCYIVIGVFLSWKLPRTRAWPTVLLFVLSAATHVAVSSTGPYNNSEFVTLVSMLPYFLGGAVVYKLRDRLPMRPLIAFVCAVVAVALIRYSNDYGPQLASPLIAYVVLWLGAVLPSPSLVKIHDISYGVYIFHFPVIQFLVLLGLHRHGFALLLVVAVAVTIVLATASWLGVERAAMRWSRGRRPWGDLRQAAR